MLGFGIGRKKRAVVEKEKNARLDEAEAELADLKKRASVAIRVLDNRRQRNHWRDAITEMIQGV